MRANVNRIDFCRDYYDGLNISKTFTSINYRKPFWSVRLGSGQIWNPIPDLAGFYHCTKKLNRCIQIYQ